MTWSKLDETKHRAQTAMRQAADRAKARAKSVIEHAFETASRSAMAAKDPAEVERVRQTFIRSVMAIQGAFDANDR